MANPKLKNDYECTECGWSAPKWVGRCGECQAWGTVQLAGAKGSTGVLRAVKPSLAGEPARSIVEVATTAVTASATGVAEFDRVLGGGLVAGAVVLLSGEPGVGKSTLLLEVAARAAAGGKRVLYVSGEESLGQIKLRAERTGALAENLLVAAETELESVLGQIEATGCELLVVDSVQTIAASGLEGAAGMPTQVREVASNLIRVAKNQSIPVILVGHVTKDGTIAGPRVLEHLVDVVCQFEGDPQSSLRFIRTLKNRFGSTEEVGCFEMTEAGIRSVADPSGFFLNQRDEAVSGTCATVAIEGRRAITVEVQALVVKTGSPQPRRVSNGVDPSRLAMILAILERRAGLKLSEHDVYISTVAGVRLSEPAADLPIALAIASVLANQAIPRELAAWGELSLTGEVRSAPHDRLRVAEAKRLGFSRQVTAEAGSIRELLRSVLG